jgi:hypothetical protein
MVYGRPVSGNFLVQVLIADGSTLQPGSKGLRAAVRDVILHRLVDEPAALAWLGHPRDRANSSFRQDDVDPFAHGNEKPMLIHILYTMSV